MGQVPEAEGDTAEVFESVVDGLGGAVGGAWPVEEREHVSGAPVQGPAQAAYLH